jgi:hypothetical protein
MVIRPDRPERFPLVVLVHGTLAPVVRPFVPRLLTNRRPSLSVRQWHLRSVATQPYRSCAVALVVRNVRQSGLSSRRANSG